MRSNFKRKSNFDILYSHYLKTQQKLDKLSKQKRSFNELRAIQSLKRHQLAILKTMFKGEFNKYFG